MTTNQKIQAIRTLRLFETLSKTDKEWLLKEFHRLRELAIEDCKKIDKHTCPEDIRVILGQKNYYDYLIGKLEEQK
nr:MAG TPA: hypothetical protein [Caudoviricetes sp.]